MGGRPALSEPAWRFACPDWIDRLREGRSLVPDLPLDPVEGERAVKVFNKLHVPDVVGQPRMAEAAGDWMRDIVRAAFGSLDPASGRRRVGEIFCLVPKKNAKTTQGAAIALTALLMNERPRAELLMVGPTQEVADTGFQQASGMVDADPYLRRRFLVQEHLKTIVDRKTKAKLKIKTFDMKVMTGTKPVFVLLDELHVMSSLSYATRVIGQIRGGLLANPESLLVIITTQSDQAPAGAFKSELTRARAIRDGKMEGGLLPILYEFPPAMQLDKTQPWADPANWAMVSPNLGRSITLERLTADFQTARDLGEEEVRRWASQHLNIEIGMALHGDRWRGADYWTDAADPTLSLETLIERCEVAVVGIDGGGLDDLLGLAVIGRCRTTRDWLAWGKAWAHSDVFERRKDIAETLRDFEKDRDLVECLDPTQDIVEVADIVQRLKDAGLLPQKNAVGLDPQGVAAMVQELGDRGVTAEQMVAVPQGYRLSGAVWGAERKLKDGTLWHADQALTAWCVGNAKAEPRGNAVLITKETAGKAKIDPLMALFNAFQLMSRNPEAASPVYAGLYAQAAKPETIHAGA